MLEICQSISLKHSLTSIAMIHRLGVVPIGEESILIAISCPHRQAAWRAGEEALEECKEKVEVWKKEEFGGEEGGAVVHDESLHSCMLMSIYLCWQNQTLFLGKRWNGGD